MAIVIGWIGLFVKYNVIWNNLNTKERQVFFNYHITHHTGTNLFIMADRANIPWDGVNGIYLPPTQLEAIEATIGKVDIMKRWMDEKRSVLYPPKQEVASHRSEFMVWWKQRVEFDSHFISSKEISGDRMIGIKYMEFCPVAESDYSIDEINRSSYYEVKDCIWSTQTFRQSQLKLSR